MKLSDAGLAAIAKWEGWRSSVYLDVGGKATIGYGHLVRPGEHFATPITQAMGLALLRNDARIAEDAVNSGVTVPLSQSQFDALVSFTFNCGSGALLSSTVLRKLNAGDYSAAADHLLDWCKVNGQTNVDLLHRRQSERERFLGSPLSHPVAPNVTTTLGVQQALNALGWTPRLAEDGILGPKTHAALAAWQAAHHLDDDGIAGPETRAALERALAAP